jgi:AcrR family transcriptional regulator
MHTSSGRRERKKSQTREAIVRAAVDLFERKGVDATTIDEIAEAADVSSRTFFRYFDTKLDVILQDKDEAHPALEDVIAGRPADEDPIAAFHYAMRAELGLVMANNPLAARQFRLMLTTPALRAAALDHFHEHQRELVAVFARRLGDSDDDLRPRVMAAAASGAVWTTVEQWATRGGSVDELPTMIDEAMTLLRRGFS